MEREFKVIGKGLKGKYETAYVTLKTADGEKMTLHLEGKHLLPQYEIDQHFTVKILKEQQTLA